MNWLNQNKTDIRLRLALTYISANLCQVLTKKDIGRAKRFCKHTVYYFETYRGIDQKRTSGLQSAAVLSSSRQLTHSSSPFSRQSMCILTQVFIFDITEKTRTIVNTDNFAQAMNSNTCDTLIDSLGTITLIFAHM